MNCRLTLNSILLPERKRTINIFADPMGETLSDIGHCLACGEERQGTEPDAECYPCEACGLNLVFGDAQLLFMGRLEPLEDKG